MEKVVVHHGGEHNGFISLYRQELSQERVLVQVVDVDKIPNSTVTICPDMENKDIKALDLVIPDVSSGYTCVP